MERKMKKDDRAVTPIVGTILMILIGIIVAATIATITFGLGGFQNKYYKIQTVKQLDDDSLLVKTLNYSNSPLPNVTLKVLEHGEGRLLIGPYVTNESGYTIIPIPHGYEERFDIVGEYENVTNTITIDRRPILVKSEDTVGSLGIQIIAGIILIIVGIVIEKSRNRLRQTKSKEKSEDNTNP
jgi:hypothetical protein